MTTLSNDRNTPRRVGRMYCILAAASKVFYTGALLCVNAAGHGVPGTTATGLRGIGRVSRRVESGEEAGEITVDYERGVFRYMNSAAADAITRADIGQPCYVVDDQTVAKTDDEGARSLAGTVDDVDATGVWVSF